MKGQEIQSALRKGRFATNDSSTNPVSIQPNTPDRSSPKRVTVPSLPRRSNKKRKKTKLAIKGYGRSGTIQSRTSTSSLLLQRWTTSHWLHVFPATINVFDSKKKMKKWQALNNAKEGESSVKSAMQKKLVQKSLNFDTQGKLQRKIDMYERKGTGTDVKSQVMTNITSYVMEDVRSKYYKRNTALLHTCKISYLSHTGRTIVAAFGSSEPAELKKIRSISRYCIRLVRKASESPRTSSDGDHKSTFSGMTHGAMSAVSTTHYGEVTMTNKTKKSWRRKKHRASLHKYGNDAESFCSGASRSVDRHNIEVEEGPKSIFAADRAQSWVRGN